MTGLLSPLRSLAARPGRSPRTVAAVDLGSNSFHMIVARSVDGELHIVDRLQEMVRLAGGLDKRGNLDRPARQRALECLRRFGERLRDLPPGAVRAVGTDTLRRARNGKKFLAAAECALGHSIDIISGQEEARLIYHGVASELSDDDSARLVVDIGGGSTEFIVGRQLEPLLAESLHIGCAGATRSHFRKGHITPRAWRQTLTAAHLELQPIETPFRSAGWRSVYGASGTVRAVGAVLRSQGWTDGEITPAALDRLRDTLFEAGHVAQLALPGLSPDRAAIFPGGVALLVAVFEALGIERMDVASGGLREGLLYDLIGRIQQTDARDRTIAALTARSRLDTHQAQRVQHTAAQLLAQVAPAWRLDDTDARALSWAAHLHEVGLTIAHTKYHRHGAYLVANSDLPGFSREDQALVATLIRVHRRRFPLEVFDELPKRERRTARRLALLLRLAVLLHRVRTATPPPPIKLAVHGRTLRLQFARGWLRKNPLTCADLEQEAEYLRSAKYVLEFC